ncbi:hypothetical protein [Thermovibrio sp.]
MNLKYLEWLVFGFYAVVSLAVPYALFYLIPFKLKFFEEKKPSGFWEELPFVDRFSLALLLFNFLIGTGLLFISSFLYCFFSIEELYTLFRRLSQNTSRFFPLRHLFHNTSCFFLDHIVYGFLFLIFGYFALGLFRRAGFLFSFIVFLIALGGWILIVSGFYGGG